VSEERNVKHFRDCEPTIEKVRTTLASTQKKLKGNVVLQRQVMKPEKEKLVSQEKASSIQTANETRHMIEQLCFLSPQTWQDLDSDRYLHGKHTMCSDGISSITKDRCTLDMRQFEERNFSLAGVIILEAPATVCSHPPHAHTNK
jgi:hypothetical protein